MGSMHETVIVLHQCQYPGVDGCMWLGRRMSLRGSFFKNNILIEVLRGNRVTYNPVTLKDHQILSKFP